MDLRRPPDEGIRPPISTTLPGKTGERLGIPLPGKRGSDTRTILPHSENIAKNILLEPERLKKVAQTLRESVWAQNPEGRAKLLREIKCVEKLDKIVDRFAASGKSLRSLHSAIEALYSIYMQYDGDSHLAGNAREEVAEIVRQLYLMRGEIEALANKILEKKCDDRLYCASAATFEMETSEFATMIATKHEKKLKKKEAVTLRLAEDSLGMLRELVEEFHADVQN